jgi:glutamine amidotransferase
MKHVRVVDYDAGNLFNVIRAFEYLGCRAELASRPEDVGDADYLVLPGVGAFGDGAASLRDRGMVEPLLEWIKAGRPFLGICLGMQLLLSSSNEFGQHEGLGIIPGEVRRLSQEPEFKVPNIGWNPLMSPEHGQPDPWRGTILERITLEQDLYFVHSYAAYPDDLVHWLARTQFGSQWFCSALRKDNVFGCQFHPEKSGPAGLFVLDSFLRVT